MDFFYFVILEITLIVIDIAANVVLLLLFVSTFVVATLKIVHPATKSLSIVDRHLIPIVCSFKREHLTVVSFHSISLCVNVRLADFECELIESKYSPRMGAIALLRFPPTKRTFERRLQ